jgi:hypothetical protein
MAEPHLPAEPASPEEKPSEPRRSYTTKRAERSVALARQPWSEFLRDLAIRFAVVLGAVLVVAIVWWLLHR